MTESEIEKEIQRRADWYKPQTHLLTNYYRVRRRIAYTLPMPRMHIPAMKVGLSEIYPFSVWMSWELEERIHSLAWAATWFNDEQAREKALADIEALAGWPTYRQYPRTDLSLGHLARLLWVAHRHWDWLGGVKNKIKEAFARIVPDAIGYSDQVHGRFTSKEQILAAENPPDLLRNIPFIGTVGVALAAHAIGHESTELLDRRLHAILGAILDSRQNGFSEGVAYDGYVMDFAVHWLEAIGPAKAAPILNHPRFADLLDESIALGLPGQPAHVAEIGDVEPKEMPFHLSAHAKLYAMKPDPRAAWLLQRCPLDWLKADALAAMHAISAAGAPTGGPPLNSAAAATTCAFDAHYALSLRSGWEHDDLAVAMSASNSPMGHLQHDAGTLVIGSRGKWLISDPGYQQYMKKREREFTLGPAAHNAPVINGQAQVDKTSPRIVQFEQLPAGISRAAIDLTARYSPELALKSVTRTVWLNARRHVVVADQVRGDAIERISYHWHGHPDAAWHIADGRARICFPDVTLWFSSPQARIVDANLDRLPGSRGQLTLSVECDIHAPVIWWVFAIGDEAPNLKPAADGGMVEVEGVEYRL